MGLAKSLTTIGFGMFKGALRRKRFKKSPFSYFILTGHPDDEVLISGLLQRLGKTNSDAHLVCLTDGDYNASGEQRRKELADAIELTGLENSPVVMHSEKEIYRSLIEGSNKDLEDLINHLIDGITEQISEIRPDFVLVPDYSGVHIIHDLTQFIGFQSVRESFCQTRKPMRIYEFPQCVLKDADDYSRDELTQALKNYLNKNIKMPSPIKIMVGELSSKPGPRPGLNDSNLGIFMGKLKLNARELYKKAFAHRKIYSSQKNSFSRYLNFYQLGDVSVETFREVSAHRDFSKRPSESPLLYEVSYWRARDFGRIPMYEDFLKTIRSIGYGLSPSENISKSMKEELLEK